MMPQERDALRSQLVLHEGCKLRPYSDTKGILTIGIGRNLRDKGITMTTAQQMLDEDIDECLTDLAAFPWFGNLDPVRLRAVIDFRFNVGPGTFRSFKRFLGAMDRKDYEEAARQLEQSQWAMQVQPARSHRLIAQIRSGADV